MLSFRVNQFQLSGRHYLLLPKLTQLQVDVLARRLVKEGYSVQASHVLSAASREGNIRVYPSGLCRSSFDPADTILPIIPEILAFPKQKIPLEEVERMYFTAASARGMTTMRLFLRMESATVWDALRAAGECGLAPDEQAVASFFLRASGMTHRMLSDSPSKGAVLRVFGRKRYYDSVLDSDQAASTLRVAGEGRSRNSYLPRDSKLRFRKVRSPSHEAMSELFTGLGEWCFYSPA